MRKIVFQMMTTLNGRLDDPYAWVASVSDDLYTEIDRVYGAFDTVLVGRVTYEEMFAYWPGAETEADGSAINKSMARKMNSCKKFVFSRGGEEKALEWNNAELVLAQGDEDIVAFIDDLKAQPGGDIHLAGGAPGPISDPAGPGRRVPFLRASRRIGWPGLVRPDRRQAGHGACQRHSL